MEKRFCQGQVLLPISESVFQFDTTRLKDTNVGQFTAVGIEFQQHFIELLVNWGYGSFQIVAGRILRLGFFASRATTQHDIALLAGRVCADVEFFAELRELGLAGK